MAQHDPRPISISRLGITDHWRQLDTGIAWEALARLLEADETTLGNAAGAWLQAGTHYRAYSDAWSRAGGASRWDPSYQDETRHAFERFQTLRERPTKWLEPEWLNLLLAGQLQEALEPALAEAVEGLSDAIRSAAGKVLAVYCLACGAADAAERLHPQHQSK